MLAGIFRSDFRSKCKSLLSRIQSRLEVIKKGRNAMQGFLKNDIAQLLKNNLERHAYGNGRKTGVSYFAFIWIRLEIARLASMVEGLYKELVLSSCYEFVEQCCTCIAENLKEMNKQSDCPLQCRVAVASLVYAATRFVDLPELRDLRNEFHDKYGKTVVSFVDKEFMNNLKSRPPTTEMKLQLLQVIAQEFSMKWDPQVLEEQLQHASPPTQESKYGASGDGCSHLFNNRSNLVQRKGKWVEQDGQIIKGQTPIARTRRRKSCSGLNENIAEDIQLPSCVHEVILENNTRKKPFTYTNHIERKNNTNEDNECLGKAKLSLRPRSVRTKFLKPPPSSCADRSSEHEVNPMKLSSARVSQPRQRHDLLKDHEKEEERMYDFLTQFGKKTAAQTSISTRKHGNEMPKVLDLPPPPSRRRYLFAESQSASLIGAKSNSLT
ncbi:unnamed protein product [Amaranthus hypochondriacus]